MSPIDYASTFSDVASPYTSVMEGIKNGAALQQIQLQRQQQAAALAQQQQQQADLQALATNPTTAGIAQMSIKYPAMSEGFKRSFDMLDPQEQRTRLEQAMPVYMALQNDKPDIAVKNLRDQATALRNGGKEDQAKAAEAKANMIEQDPAAAKINLGGLLAAAIGPEKFTNMIGEQGSEQRAQELAPSELANKQAESALKSQGIVAQSAGALAKPGVKPAQAIAMFKSMETRGILPKGGAQDYIDNMPADAANLPDYLGTIRDMGIIAKEQKGYVTPDANTVANNARIAAEGSANRANQLKVTQMVSDRENSKGNEVDQTQVENVAQLIASGRMAPLGAMAMRTPYGQSVMSRVAEINPAYRAQDFGTSSKAEKDFATGKNGNAVRSFNVGLSHLDTLGQLADALGNKDTQAVNRLGNYFATQTGQEAPVKFEAAKKVVTDEIVKAIVGAGGTGHDREEAAKTVSAASSPAQLRGVIDTYKDLMVGQLGGLDQQYRTTTGRNDFNRYLSPQAVLLYGQHGGAAVPGAPGSAGGHPTDISALLNKYGKK